MTKNWIFSPLGINILKTLCGKKTNKNLNNLVNINEFLRQFTIYNKLFVLTSNEKGSIVLEKNSTFNVQTTTCVDHKEMVDALKNWVDKYGVFGQFNPNKYLLPNAKALLTNICMYKGTWKNPEKHVKIYNSFSYTEDIKYEARVLVVPISGDHIELAIIVPNETDVLHHLINKLHREGLSAALNSIQPSFTATCRQTLPMFEHASSITVKDVDDGKLTLAKHGEVKLNEGGVHIKVLTCLPVPEDSGVAYEQAVIANDCFNFAIVCRDVPIFIGQVVP